MYNQDPMLSDGATPYKVDGKALLSLYSGRTLNKTPSIGMCEIPVGAQSGESEPDYRSPEGINPIALAIGMCKGSTLPVRFMQR